MTDPFSISASIAGLITLADIVFCRICTYAKAVKNASKDVLTLRSEVDELYVILTKLRLLSIRLEENKVFEAAFRTHHVHSCHDILEKIRQVLEKSETASLKGRRLQSFKRKLQWPFKSSEVELFISEIERHKQTLSLALNVDSMSGLLQALSRQKESRREVQDINILMKDKFEAESRIAINKDRQQVLESFGKADPRKNLDTGRKLRHPGTGLWLTESFEFQEWLSTKDGTLWLYGIPGAGKTVLAASVIDEVLRMRNSNTAVAFFFCDHKDPTNQEAYTIMGSLAHQIAKQDEKCFEKLQKFYVEKNPERRKDILYRPTDLTKLITGMMSNFDRTIIIVDGLDECGRNTGQVVELLASLGDDMGTDCKKLFFSRDEVEIREQLSSFKRMSIAARGEDLRLYVAAEIELRMRKNKLRIKDDSLKEYIMEQLVERADGMFRWVSCQIDYLCELPNDAARRKALVSLPPDLNSTYERIFERVNQSNTEVRKLVQKSLRWIVHSSKSDYFTIDALCEVLSIEIGDSRLNEEAIPDEIEIMRWCSSLVRKSVDDHNLELAHFTVEEFLMQIDREKNKEFAPYRIELETADIEAAETCLTYLNFEDFNQEVALDRDAVQSRKEKYPLRAYAVSNWRTYANDHCNHHRILPLLKKLFHTSKPNTLISLICDRVWDQIFQGLDLKTSIRFKSGIAEASALHIAVMECVPPLCSWLIQSGCDVNKKTRFGTPLSCAILQWRGLTLTDNTVDPSSMNERQEEIFSILLHAQANIDICHTFSSGKEVSLLWLTIKSRSSSSTLQLLERGSILEANCMDLILAALDDDLLGCDRMDLGRILVHVSDKNLRKEDDEKFTRLILKAEAFGPLDSNQERFPEGKGGWPIKFSQEISLQFAAEFGQKEKLFELLKDSNLNVNSAQQGTGMTAIHYAVVNDHVQILEILLRFGGNPSQTDSEGRTALHHACSRRESLCLSILLQQDSKALPCKREMLQPLPLAFLDNESHSMSVLSNRGGNRLDPDAQSHSGETALMLAVKNRNTDATRSLLSHGCNPNVTNFTGSTLIHYACDFDSHSALASVSHRILTLMRDTTIDWNSRISTLIHGRARHNVTVLHLAAAREDSDRLEYLLCGNFVSDINGVTDFGETALSIAVWTRSVQNVSLLLSNGADATIMDQDGECPIHTAARLGYHEVVRQFLNHGCDIRIQNRFGLDSELIAIKSSDRYLAEIFRNYMLEHGVSSESHLPLPNISFYDGRGTGWSAQKGCHYTIQRASRALKIAIDFDNLDLCQRAIHDGADINHGYCFCREETPLLYSLHKMRPTVAEYLVLQGASTKGHSCERWETRGYSVFHHAASMDSSRVLKALLEKKAQEFMDLDNDIHPVHLAVANGHVECVKLMIDFADTEQSLSLRHPLVNFAQAKLANKKTCRIETSWDWRLRLGYSFPNVFYGSSPLHIAVLTGDTEMASLLIDHGATVDSTDDMLCTPLHVAVDNGIIEMVDLLLDAGANPNSLDSELRSPCALAASKGYLRCLRMLLDHGADLELKDLDRFTALDYAAWSDSSQTVAFLLNRTIQHELDVEDNSALSTFTRCYLLCPSLMLNFAPRPSTYIPERGNILSDAVNMHDARKVRMLLRRLPRELIPTLLHHRHFVLGTPLYSASTVYLDINNIQLLLYAGADLEFEGGDHGTPLMGACATGRLEAVKILIAKGARTSYSKDGKTISALRAAKNYPEILQWLLVGRFLETPRLITSG